MIGADTLLDVWVVITLTTPGGSPASVRIWTADLAGRHGQREVPRRDQKAGPDRVLRDDHSTGALGIDAVTAEDPYRLLGEPAQKLAAVLDLSL